LNVAPEAKAGPFLEIAADVSTAFTEFLRQATKEKLHDCWHGGVPV
jgi:hypothetical protein